MSTHAVTVVKIHLEPHPNAEALSIMKLDSGNVVVLRTTDWTEGELAVHVQPDYEVNVEHKAFSWLATKDEAGNIQRPWERIKVAKWSGVSSYGLMAPVKEFATLAREGAVEGENVLEKLRSVIRRWDAPVNMQVRGEVVSGPANIVAPKYDVENYYKYADNFIAGEQVVATEKLHGSNGRYVWDGEKFHCGSRSEWKAQDATNPWWRALENTPGLKDFLVANPKVVVYGEVYGTNPGYKYGVERGDQVRFAIFDLLLQTSLGPQWADWDVLKEARRQFHVPFESTTMWVPIIYEGPYDLETMKDLASGSTNMPGANPGDIREGIVVKPVKERTFGPNGERLQVKFVSDEYLEKS